jgi:hypothetical protein
VSYHCLSRPQHVVSCVLSGPDAGNIHVFLATPIDEPLGLSIADSHLHTRNPVCPRTLANRVCRLFHGLYWARSCPRTWIATPEWRM